MACCSKMARLKKAVKGGKQRNVLNGAAYCTQKYVFALFLYCRPYDNDLRVTMFLKFFLW